MMKSVDKYKILYYYDGVTNIKYMALYCLAHMIIQRFVFINPKNT